MPDYDLGKAHGSVEITYDDKAVGRAKRDVDDLGTKSGETSKKVQTADAEMQGAYDNLAKAISGLSGEVDKHATAEVVAKAKVAAAEENLRQVRANGEATAKDLKTAEKAVQQAQNQTRDINQRLSISTAALASARQKLNGIPLKPPDPGPTNSALDKIRQHLKNVDDQTKKSASGLNTFTGRTKVLAAGVAISIPAVAGLGVALADLTGLAGVAAGAIAALAATAATLAVGTAGISDVFKAAAADSKAAGGAAASSASQQRAAARAIEDAQRSLADAYENLQQVREEAARAAIQAERAILSAQRDLVNAQRDALRAQESLTKARLEATRQLEDMRAAITGGALDERQAILDLKEAEAELAKIKRDPTANADDIEQATINYERQKLALEQAGVANQRLGDDSAVAAAKGVAGSEAVVSAQDAMRGAMQAVADAQQGVADAQEAARLQQVESARAVQDAVRGIADAQRALEDAYASAATAAAGGASKTADAMSKISPGARAVVKEILGLSDAWQAVKFSVQDRLFAGLADDVKPLAQIYFPLLQKGMGGIADGLNGIVKETVAYLKTTEAQENISHIFGNTGQAMANLRPILKDLLAAFLDIASVGSDFLPDMATGAANAATKFRDFIHAAKESGRLREWMQDAMDTVSQLWQLIKNLGSIIGTVFSAFDQEGGGALNTLTALTGQIDKFLKSAEGQEALHALGRILASIGGAYGKVFLSFLDAAAEILVALEPFITAFADAVGTYLAGAIQVALPILKGLADIIGFLGPALGPVVAGMYAANKVVGLAKTAWAALNTVMKANPFILIAGAVIALAILIYENWDAISAFLAGVWNGIKDLASTVWNAIRDYFVGLWNDISTQWVAFWTGFRDFFVGIANDISTQWTSFWNGVRDFFVNIGTTIKTQVSNFVNAVVNFFRDLPGKVWDFVKSLPGKFLQLGKDIVSGILRGLSNLASALWNKLKDAVSDAWDSVLDFFGISSPSKLAMYAGEMITKGFANGIDGSTKQVVQAAQNMVDAASVALPGFDPTSPSGMAFAAGTGRSQPVGLALPTQTAAAAQSNGATTIYVGSINQQVTGNLDPTKPVEWRKAMVSLKDGIRQVDRDYAK